MSIPPSVVAPSRLCKDNRQSLGTEKKQSPNQPTFSASVQVQAASSLRQFSHLESNPWEPPPERVSSSITSHRRIVLHRTVVKLLIRCTVWVLEKCLSDLLFLCLQRSQARWSLRFFSPAPRIRASSSEDIVDTVLRGRSGTKRRTNKAVSTGKRPQPQQCTAFRCGAAAAGCRVTSAFP